MTALREAVRKAAVFCECLTDDTCDRVVAAVLRAAVEAIPESPIAKGFVEIGFVIVRRGTLLAALKGEA